mgnify:CR=1 FL=1
MTAINYRVKDIETGRKTEMSYTPNLQDAWDWFKTSEKFTFVSDLLEFTAIDGRHQDRTIDIVEAAYEKMIQEFKDSIVIMHDVTAEPPFSSAK